MQFLLKKKFLAYALLLHFSIILSCVIFGDTGKNPELNKNRQNEEKIINIDISKPKETIQAETINDVDIDDELEAIKGLKSSFNNNKQIEKAELEEQKRELASIKKQRTDTAKKLIQEKKQIQKDKMKLINQKKDLEKEIKKLKNDAILKKKSDLAKKELAAKKKADLAKKELAAKKKADLAKKELATKKINELKRIKYLKQKKLADLKRDAVNRAKLAKNKIDKEIAFAKKAEQSKKNWLESDEGESAYYKYGSSVMTKIQNGWVRPLHAKKGWVCNMVVIQNKRGFVQDIKDLNCNPDNLDFKNSVIQAVMKASPLPIPSDSRLFDPNGKVKVGFSVD